MLKKTLLGGIVLMTLALTVSLSIATATTFGANGGQTGKLVPKAPIPQGFCLPPGIRC